MREVRASLRRHWTLALAVVLLIPVVVAVYLANRDVTRPPARYTTSADVLIPSRTAERGELDPTVPPVVLQGQPELASSAVVIDTALEASDLEGDETEGINFANALNEDKTIMTLSVSAPEPDVAARVLDEYLIAYQDGRRKSVRDSSFDRADVQVGTIGILNRQLAEVERELRENDIALPAQQEQDTVIPIPASVDEASVLLIYERNAILSERDLRRADYSRQITAAAIPGDYSDVVQRRSTARITPPPPSPLVPLLTIIGVGLLLAALIPVLRDRLDPTITEAKAAPGALRAGVLGTIPFMPRRLNQQLAPPGSTWELAFRSLAATSLSTDRLPKALMVTSPTGSTQARVAANFAVELAGLGVSVALIGTLPEHSWFLADVMDEAEGSEDRTITLGADPGAGATLTGVRTLPELLQEAEGGRLIGDIRSRLATRGIANLHIVPPGAEGTDLGTLDGLPPLLDALSRSGIDICVIAGPAFLEDPHATIMAWSTRHVLWAIEMGQVNKADAQLAADRVELAGVTPFGIAIVNRHALRT
jgi:hypothetical protein